MANKMISKVLATMVVFLAPVMASAQGGGADQIPPEARELLGELQSVQAELAPIQQAALQDPEIQSAQQDLSERVRSAMTERDPQAEERIKRLEELSAQARAAQAEQDQERMAEIITEAQQIEQRLQAVQAQALESPEIAPRLEAFRTRLQEKMVEVEPEAEALIERATELEERLAEIIG